EPRGGSDRALPWLPVAVGPALPVEPAVRARSGADHRPPTSTFAHRSADPLHRPRSRATSVPGGDFSAATLIPPGVPLHPARLSAPQSLRAPDLRERRSPLAPVPAHRSRGAATAG